MTTNVNSINGYVQALLKILDAVRDWPGIKTNNGYVQASIKITDAARDWPGIKTITAMYKMPQDSINP